nr:hypothetical protein [uncultured Psychroserpens sp.]
MDNYEYLYTLNNIIYTFASLCIIVAGITLFSKKRTLSTTLILVGSIIAFLFSIGSIFISAYVVFCVGLMLFTITDYKKEVPKNEFLDD